MVEAWKVRSLEVARPCRAPGPQEALWGKNLPRPNPWSPPSNLRPLNPRRPHALQRPPAGLEAGPEGHGGDTALRALFNA